MSTPHITTLPSGLRIATDTMPDVASVSLGLWFGVGTRFEKADEAGLSHLLEHMFFKGTANRDAQTLNQTIETVGGSLNAYTSREQTAYHARVLAEDAPLALELLADMMFNSKFDEAALKSEKSVIAAEIGEAYDAPDDWVFDLFQKTAYPDQPLGLPVLGDVKSLATITRSQLTNYIAANYRADRCILAGAGALRHEQLVALGEQFFATLPGGTPHKPVPAQYKGGSVAEARDIEQLHLCLGHRGVTYGHELFHAQNLFATALGGGTSSRLFHQVREERGLAYSVSSFMMPLNDDGLLVVYLAADPERASEAVNVSLRELRTLADTMTQAELDRARALIRASLLMGLESTESRAERLAAQLLQYNRLIPIEETLNSLARVTLDDIKRYAALMLGSPLTRVALGPVDALEW